MKKNPDRSLEALRVREELSQDHDALHALDALAKHSKEESEVPIPPVPDDLRDLWEDRYGQARKEATAKGPGFFEKLTAHWSHWALGGAVTASVAAIALLFVLNQGGPASSPGNQPPIMRGGGDFQPTRDTVILFIASDTITFQQFLETREGGLVLEVADEQGAQQIITDRKLSEAILLDANTNTMRLWKDGFGKDIPLLETPGDVFDLSEALENHLE